MIKTTHPNGDPIVFEVISKEVKLNMVMYYVWGPASGTEGFKVSSLTFRNNNISPVMWMRFIYQDNKLVETWRP